MNEPDDFRHELRTRAEMVDDRSAADSGLFRDLLRRRSVIARAMQDRDRSLNERQTRLFGSFDLRAPTTLLRSFFRNFFFLDMIRLRTFRRKTVGNPRHVGETGDILRTRHPVKPERKRCDHGCGESVVASG
jgi:hypothetical protein